MENLEKFLDKRTFNSEFELLITILQYSGEMFNQYKFTVEDIISFKGFMDNYIESRNLFK